MPLGRVTYQQMYYTINRYKPAAALVSPTALKRRNRDRGNSLRCARYASVNAKPETVIHVAKPTNRHAMQSFFVKDVRTFSIQANKPAHHLDFAHLVLNLLGCLLALGDRLLRHLFSLGDSLLRHILALFHQRRGFFLQTLHHAWFSR